MVFEEPGNSAWIEVCVVPAAAPGPETQEEILAAVLAARDECDVPAEDDSWVIVDSDGDRPAELAGLDGAELDELLAAASSGPAGAAAGRGPGGEPGFAEGGVLDVLAPGVALAGCADDAHAGLGGLTDDELIGVLRAWARQESWAQARKLAAVTELARRRPSGGAPPARPGQPPANVSEFTADEVGLALTLTRRSAGAQLDLALALAARPATAVLLETGEIDLIRARVIMDGLTGLTAEHAAAVEAAVLPEAPAMTSGQLRAAVAGAVLAADPDAARRDREERLKDARVECWTDPTGTANLAGRDLPSAQTLAADKRLCQIARAWKKQLAAAWRQAGQDGRQPRPAAATDLLRARAYLALLLGQPVSAPPADLLPGGAAHVPGVPPGPGQPAPDGTGRPGHSPAGKHPAGAPVPDLPPGLSRPAPGAGDGLRPGLSRPVRGPGDVLPPGLSGPGPGDVLPPGLSGLAPGSGDVLPPGLSRPAPGPGATLPPLAGQVFLTLPLATLLGLSDAPGHAAGYGPLDPDTGRALARAAAGHPAAGWHLIITDPHGHAVGYGHAPRARSARRPPAGRHPSAGYPGAGYPGTGHPGTGHPADGWTITLTTERIAHGQSP
jgi:hypothetical protein